MSRDQFPVFWKNVNNGITHPFAYQPLAQVSSHRLPRLSPEVSTPPWIWSSLGLGDDGDLSPRSGQFPHSKGPAPAH